MPVYQILKDEKSSLINHPYYRDNALQRWGGKTYSCLLHFYQKIIKRQPLSLKKPSESKSFEKENILNNLTGNSDLTDIIRIEISSAKMNELLARHQICAADVRCLDIKSKQCLKKLCLKTCLYNTKSSNLAYRHPDNLNLSETQNLP